MTQRSLTVYGKPAPQGSKRHVGGGRMVESSKALEPWREAVKQAALTAIRVDAGGEVPIYAAPLDGPLTAVMTFTMPKPASAPKTRRTYPSTRPDLSKLVRAVEDALTDAGVWKDDARLVTLYAVKVYPGESPAALDRPGVRVVVTTVEDGEAAAA